jgi:hypothetical protein
VRLALLVALVLVVQPGVTTTAALVAMIALLGALVLSVRRPITVLVISVLVAVGVALRLALLDQLASDVLQVTSAAIHEVLAGRNPYGVGYAAARPPGAPFPYGPLALLWYLPVLDAPRLAELASGTAILAALAARGRLLGLAIYATAPIVVRTTIDGSNDTSAGLLILMALATFERRPLLGGVLLAAAASFKLYALAWLPGMIWFGGVPAALGFAAVSLLAWSPVLLVWGPASFVRSLQRADALPVQPYFSLGAILETLLGRPVAAELLDRARFILGAATAAVGVRFSSSSDAVIVVGAMTFLVALYAGDWATPAYLGALAPIVCWRLDRWLSIRAHSVMLRKRP